MEQTEFNHTACGICLEPFEDVEHGFGRIDVALRRDLLEVHADQAGVGFGCDAGDGDVGPGLRGRGFDVMADARIVRVGRTTSFGRVSLSSAVDRRPVGMVSSAYAML